MEQQEYIMRINMLGQEAEKVEQQIQAIDQQMSELSAVQESLEAIKEGNAKNGKDSKNNQILAHLGKGIFASAELKDNSLFVNVGQGVIIKKTPEKTIQIIDGETERMIVGKERFLERIGEIQQNMQGLMQEFQEKGNSDEGGCGSPEGGCEDSECECEEPCEDCECEKKGKKK